MNQLHTSFRLRMAAFALSTLALSTLALSTSLAATGQTIAASSATASKSSAPFTRFSVQVEGPSVGVALNVLLIPGLGSSRAVYSAEAELLIPSFRLHLIQIAGFAGEPAGPNADGAILGPVVEELHRYIAQTHLRHPAVIGHSLGGLLALMLAAAHPDDVGSLLIIDALPFYGLIFSPTATVEMVRPQGQQMRDSLLAQPADQFAAGQQMMVSRLAASLEGQKAVVADSIASDRTVFANAFLEDLTTDLRPRMASIKTPVTVLYPWSAAEGSKAEVDSLYRGAFAAMPQARLVRIEGSSHFIMFDQPAAFHQAVKAFLSETGN